MTRPLPPAGVQQGEYYVPVMNDKCIPAKDDKANATRRHCLRGRVVWCTPSVRHSSRQNGCGAERDTSRAGPHRREVTCPPFVGIMTPSVMTVGGGVLWGAYTVLSWPGSQSTSSLINRRGLPPDLWRVSPEISFLP